MYQRETYLAFGLITDYFLMAKPCQRPANLKLHIFFISQLLAVILTSREAANLTALWQKHQDSLAEDILYAYDRNELENHEQILHQCLVLIQQHVMKMSEKTLKHYFQMKMTMQTFTRIKNYSQQGQKASVAQHEHQLTPDQRHV